MVCVLFLFIWFWVLCEIPCALPDGHEAGWRGERCYRKAVCIGAVGVHRCEPGAHLSCSALLSVFLNMGSSQSELREHQVQDLSEKTGCEYTTNTVPFLFLSLFLSFVFVFSFIPRARVSFLRLKRQFQRQKGEKKKKEQRLNST